ncbi:hypothetical protein MRX96_021536 [Rhipicephalus microplus]
MAPLSTPSSVILPRISAKGGRVSANPLHGEQLVPESLVSGRVQAFSHRCLGIPAGLGGSWARQRPRHQRPPANGHHTEDDSLTPCGSHHRAAPQRWT